MNVLQSGYPKSGNYWLFCIIELSMAEAGIRPCSFIMGQPIYQVARHWELSFPGQAGIDMINCDFVNYYYEIAPMYKRRIVDVEAYVAACSHVWTHAGWMPKLMPKLYWLFDKVVHIIRDPRDAFLSRIDQTRTPFYAREFGPAPGIRDKLSVHCIAWASHTKRWLDSDAHVVEFENLVTEFDAEYGRLLKYLGLDLSTEARARVAEAVSLQAMKMTGGHHINKGRAWRWPTEMSAEDNARVVDQRVGIGAMLTAVGYPLTVNAKEKGR